ncbi:hypothetical protein GCM10009760_25230 [Kitasatospora kazusensis]|uniref:LPXTG cell wall anchor domain-containing protein n=1 Tax=Kitasatospora kazusensis TaxID=407974 RepID=A0ABP5L5N9_9ACTN
MITPLTLAGVASAHTQQITSTCDSVTVDVTLYNADEKYKNTISVTIDGKAVVTDQRFPASFNQTFKVDPKHAAPIEAVVTVATSENPKNPDWNKTLTEKIPVCPVTPPPSHSASPSPSPSVSASHSATPSPSVTPSASKPATPTPTPSGPVLASTGGGSDAPMIAGIGAAVVALGGGLLFANRRRAARRH